jgi:hypothetical protein
MKKYLLRIVMLITLVSLSGVTYAQDPAPKKEVSRKQKKFAKIGENQDQKAARQQEEGRKKHYKLQEKQVRKRMKKAEKKAKRYNNSKREFFLKRWFRRK